jgi:excisionase family DNA binding protein
MVREINEQTVSQGFMTTAEARQFLCVSRSTLCRMMDEGRLPFAVFRGHRRLPVQAVREYALQGLRMN